MFEHIANRMGVLKQGLVLLLTDGEECCFYYGSSSWGYITTAQLTEAEMLTWTDNLVTQSVFAFQTLDQSLISSEISHILTPK